ncbi:MAG: class I SAM-dependent methyltransferase [Oscillospiraceae bacterium]|jgi:SAM-dependent methyltransferase|nr:class I SAM-dependent methyltransferase [Oscillospiraceae bacterium]
MDSETVKKEETFHDGWAESINIDEVMVDEFFESPLAPENRYILEKLGDITGKSVLELGAGAGEASVYFAKKGALVTATDLSGGMLGVVGRLAEKHGVAVKTARCSADALPFADNSFDVVYAGNLLHHVDIKGALLEARRVLKDGGTFVSWDPLAHNPLINVYRKIATKVRTSDEHPIKMKELKIFKSVFGKDGVSFHTAWYHTNLIFLKMFLIERVDPNKERYWKRIYTHRELYEKTYKRLEKIDNAFLKVFPFFKRFCWNIVIVCGKGEKNDG